MRRDVLRALVCTLGALPGAALSSAAVARLWPGEPSVGHAVGLVLTLPLWVAAVSVALLDWRVWRAALALTLWAVLAALLVS